MKYLPSSDFDFQEHQKLNTYSMLSRIGCPVFKSVLVDSDFLLPDDVVKAKQYLKSDFCTIRYQYIKPTSNPVSGGNKIPLDYNLLVSKMVPDTWLWLLEPIDRLRNDYGINMLFNRDVDNGSMIFECVGKGFDVSDLNRGDANPHQRIIFRLPIEYGWNREWWKFAKFIFTTDTQYNMSKAERLKKLKRLGLEATESIFNFRYVPLSLQKIESLLEYAELLDLELMHEKFFVTSCSVDYNGRIIFWDIQTPEGKIKILGGN